MRPNRPRLRTFDYIGRYRYFLTFTTHHRQRLFTEPRIVDQVVDQILRAADRCDVAVTTYCAMPDHLHLLVKGRTDRADLREFVKHAKQHSGYVHSQSVGGRLWQPSYYDRVLRDDESDLFVIAYMLRNPVEAGLVKTCCDYRFAGSGTTTLEALIAMLCEGLGPDWERR
jgi:putative transposase